MAQHPFRDRAAIVGVGYTEFSRNSGVSTLALALRAISEAVGGHVFNRTPVVPDMIINQLAGRAPAHGPLQVNCQ